MLPIIKKMQFNNKTRILASEMLKRRVEEKSRQKNMFLNSAHFQVISDDSQGLSPSLLVHSEGKSYLFNCSEGTQRFCTSNKIKISHLENVFLTNLDWNRVSGVFGLALTIHDLGAPSLCLHSTPNIKDIFSATNSFMNFTTGMECNTKTSFEEFVDHGMRINPILLKSQSAYSNIMDERSQALKKLRVDSNLIAYHCSLTDMPGHLDPKKCRELKVPIGPQLAILKSGQDVKLSDGRIIKSSEVCGPKNPGIQFLVVDCPSERNIEDLSANSVINELKGIRDTDQDRQIDLVIHFTPKDLVNDSKYQEWMDSFDKNCKHLILSNSSKLNLIEVYRFQYLLNKIDKVIFPKLSLPPDFIEKTLPPASDTPAKPGNLGDDEVEEIYIKSEYEDLGNKSDIASLTKINIRPSKFIESPVVYEPLDTLYRDVMLDSLFQKELIKLQELQKNLPEAKHYEPEVVFLGTGSALPSKLRNTSCILINLFYPEKYSILMDCGEDSYGQMIKHYGQQQADEVLKQVKLIYVSHYHADHHLGLTKLLINRKRLTKERVILLLPPYVDDLLNYHNENFEDISDTYEIVPTKPLRTRPTNTIVYLANAKKIRDDLCNRLNGLLESIKIVGVEHCAYSCGVVMRFNIGHPEMKNFSVGYSGDARPSDDFIIAGKSCDLLIHEATFDYRHQADAILKKHSTSHEAIDVGRQMNAKFTILTHFSQRYPKIPFFTEMFDDKVGFAFDHLSMRCPSHYNRLPIMKPAMKLAFKKSLNEMEMKYDLQEQKRKVINEMLESKSVY